MNKLVILFFVAFVQINASPFFSSVLTVGKDAKDTLQKKQIEILGNVKDGVQSMATNDPTGMLGKGANVLADVIDTSVGMQNNLIDAGFETAQTVVSNVDDVVEKVQKRTEEAVKNAQDLINEAQEKANAKIDEVRNEIRNNNPLTSVQNMNQITDSVAAVIKQFDDIYKSITGAVSSATERLRGMFSNLGSSSTVEVVA